MNRKLYVALGVVLMAAAGLSACSSTPDYKGVYESEQEETGLEVPPGLDAPQTNTDLSLPEQQDQVRTYSGYSDTVLNKPRDSMIETYDDMRFVREGSLFWLEVDASPGQVWNDVREFFRKVGFKIENEYPQLGMMETDWKDNRVDVPANWFGFAVGDNLWAGSVEARVPITSPTGSAPCLVPCTAQNCVTNTASGWSTPRTRTRHGSLSPIRA